MRCGVVWGPNVLGLGLPTGNVCLQMEEDSIGRTIWSCDAGMLFT